MPTPADESPRPEHEVFMLGMLVTDDEDDTLSDTEIDAEADGPDGRTVRLGALLILEAAAGLASR